LVFGINKIKQKTTPLDKLNKNKIVQRRIWLVVTILYMVAIVISSMQPSKAFGRKTVSKELFLNFLHIPAYALLTYMLIRCWLVLNRKVLIFVFISSVMFGVFNEVIQSFVPGRSASLVDVSLNVVGALLTMFILIKTEPKSILL